MGSSQILFEKRIKEIRADSNTNFPNAIDLVQNQCKVVMRPQNSSKSFQICFVLRLSCSASVL